MSQKMFRRPGRSYGNANQTIANDPGDWDDLDSLDRIQFYPDDCVNCEAIKWKRSQTTNTNVAIEGHPRNHHSYPITPGSVHHFKVAAENTECNTSLFMTYPIVWTFFETTAGDDRDHHMETRLLSAVTKVIGEHITLCTVKVLAVIGQ